MSNENTLDRLPSCFAPEINNLITAYCFGRANDEERKTLEVHVLECDYCWREVQGLEKGIHALSSERSIINSLSAADVATAFGISAKVETPLGGHKWHVLISCFLYAGLFVVTMLMEIAYQFDEYGHTALKLAPFVFLWILVTSLLALAIDWRHTSKGMAGGLAFSVLIFLAAAAALYAAMCFFLPAAPITEQSIPSSSAQSAYLKDLCYSLLLVLIFLTPTFHFVVSMQRELHLGRHRLGLELLTGGRFGVVPRGTIYPRFWMLILAVMSMAVYTAFSTANLLDHLSSSPYKNLFTNLIYLRLILYFGVALKCLSWYHRATNELKRECLLSEKTKQT